MTNATATIPRQTHHSVTAADIRDPRPAQTSGLKSWKDTMSSRIRAHGLRCPQRKRRIGRRYEDADEWQGH